MRQAARYLVSGQKVVETASVPFDVADGSTLGIVEQLGKQLCHLVKPIPNLDSR